MGVVRTVLNALLGPLLVWLALVGHVVYRHGFSTPDPIAVPDWHKGLSEQAKNAVIGRRSAILEDFRAALAGKAPVDFAEKRLTDDCVFEDPMQRWEGTEEMKLLFHDMCPRYMEKIEYDLHGVYHSTHQTVIDMTMHAYTKLFPTTELPLYMRTTIMYEPPATEGRDERIFRIQEDWFGNPQLNEKTTYGPLGRIHSKLRRFVGWMTATAVRKGYV